MQRYGHHPWRRLRAYSESAPETLGVSAEQVQSKSLYSAVLKVIPALQHKTAVDMYREEAKKVKKDETTSAMRSILRSGV